MMRLIMFASITTRRWLWEENNPIPYQTTVLIERSVEHLFPTRSRGPSFLAIRLVTLQKHVD